MSWGEGGPWQPSIVTVVARHCLSCCIAAAHCETCCFPRVSLLPPFYFTTPPPTLPHSPLSDLLDSGWCLHFVSDERRITSSSCGHSFQCSGLTQHDTHKWCYISRPISVSCQSSVKWTGQRSIRAFLEVVVRKDRIRATKENWVLRPGWHLQPVLMEHHFLRVAINNWFKNKLSIKCLKTIKVLITVLQRCWIACGNKDMFNKTKQSKSSNPDILEAGLIKVIKRLKFNLLKPEENPVLLEQPFHRGEEVT